MATIMCSTVAVSADFTHFPPKGLGSVHTYTVWDKINWGGDCKKLINFVKSNGALYDAYGIVTYGGYFAGATTSTLGKVGDMLLVVQEDGIIYPVIVSDIKNQSDYSCNVWGHMNGKCMIEFEILSCMRKFLYGSSGGYISNYINKPIYKVINIGSVYNESLYNKYFNNVKQAVLDYGLEGYFLLVNPYEGYYVIK